MAKRNKNWPSVQVGLSEDDTCYLIGLVGADLGAMRAVGMGGNDDLRRRAERTRQKLQDGLRNRKKNHERTTNHSTAQFVSD